MKSSYFRQSIDVYIETKNGHYQTNLERTSLEGGEGILYSTKLKSKHTNNKLVVKLFKESVIPKKKDKVSEIISFFQELKSSNRHVYNEIKKRVIIPLGRVFSLDGKFIGFVMEYIDITKSISLSKFNLDSKFKSYEKVGYYERLIIAYKLTKAVSLLHNVGFIIGDLNSDNILISKNGDIYLVDSDNYGFKYKNQYFPPSAIRNDIAPPEMLTKSSINNLSQASDIYALAIHIYSIFMFGFEPFNFIGSASIGDISTLKKRGINVFTSKKPPQGLPPLDILGELRKFLSSALDPDPSKRPNALEILSAIEENIRKISTCGNGHKVIPVKNTCFICGKTFNRRIFF